MKALIVEDEAVNARHLKQILEELGSIEVLEVLDSIEDTVNWFNDNSEPDILFLDIHLADGSVFEIFKKLTIQCPIVFTTAYDEYALKAFKVNSISYLLKPIKKEEVAEALNKLKQLQKTIMSVNEVTPFDMRQLADLINSQKEYKSHFLVSVRGDKLTPLKADDIAAIYVEDGLVKAHTYENKIYHIDETMDVLATQLNPKSFYRANRQFIIARNAIKDIDFWFNSRLAVNLHVSINEQILISRVKVTEFKNWFS